MKCKQCGTKVPISKPLLITVIIESILLVLLLGVIYILGYTIAVDESSNTGGTDSMYEKAANDLVNDINAAAYYNECDWCPNYGYITGAKPRSWNPGSNAAMYTYDLVNEELKKYTDELEKNFFEKNAFSSGVHTVYSRKKGDEEQTISILISQEDKTVTIFAQDKE